MNKNSAEKKSLSIFFRLSLAVLRCVLFTLGLLLFFVGIIQFLDPTWRLSNDPDPSFYVDPPLIRMLYLLGSATLVVVAIVWPKMLKLFFGIKIRGHVEN